MLKKTLVLVSVLALTACASAPKLLTGDGDGEQSLLNASKVYTQTNLHPDEERMRLYSINYQQSGFIPRCTEVSLFDISSKKLMMKINNKKYEYLYHKASGSFEDNIKKYFKTSCKKSKLRNINAIDKEGLELGKVYKGMTKEGVILAIGYPPVHKTKSLEEKRWKYWSNKFNTFDVIFDNNNKVKKIID
jgi:hypothetical protein